ncbi:MAG: MarR family transcriptional regulator [Patescibacteria group bacterium]|nr:MarR family transcriptional regulator [Patescibacteria group bacterium]
MESNIHNKLIEVVFKISRLARGSMNFNSTSSHLTFLQLQTLSFLKKKGRSQMGEIADEFSITMPTATTLLDKLADMKLVSREEDLRDRRMVIISLTPFGIKLFREAMKTRDEKIEKMLTYINSSDKKQLLRIMKHLVKVLEKNYEK